MPDFPVPLGVLHAAMVNARPMPAQILMILLIQTPTARGMRASDEIPYQYRNKLNYRFAFNLWVQEILLPEVARRASDSYDFPIGQRLNQKHRS